MSNLAQTASWFAQGFLGRIPVWDPSGNEVGYRTDYAKYTVTLYPPYIATKGAQLVTKDFVGNDEPIVVDNGTAASGSVPATAVTHAVGANAPLASFPVSVPVMLGGAAAVLVLLIILNK